MQCQMLALPQPLLLNPLKDSVKVEAMDYSSDFRNFYSRLDDFMDLYGRGKLPADMIRYIPGLTKIPYQGQIDSTKTKRKYANDTYKNEKLLKKLFLQQIIIQIFKYAHFFSS